MNNCVNKNEPLVSVVVPIYKVENYLKECVDSVINQTYQNLEIILVDDGSPDRCGEICDNYARQDNRIKVIHKTNGGLSDARNAAFPFIHGEYITFIDSDDYIENNAIETLLNTICTTGADVSVATFEIFYENGIKVSNNPSRSVEIYDRYKALDCFLFNDYLTPCVCGKLYKKSLWDNIRMPKGKLYEDQYTTYKILDRCDLVAFIREPLYHYRKREGSIGHSTFSNKTYELYDAIHEEYDFIKSKYEDKCPNIAVARITWEIVFANYMIMGKHKDVQVIKDIQKFAKANIDKINECEYVSNIRKIQMNLFTYCYPLYVISYLIYRKGHKIS